jgi:hypothetical protein
MPYLDTDGTAFHNYGMLFHRLGSWRGADSMTKRFV